MNNAIAPARTWFFPAPVLLVSLLLLIPLAAKAQDIYATVAPNAGASDNFVDIQNSGSSRWHFYSNPSPAAARMSRMDSSLISESPWPTVPNFAPDAANQVMNRIFQGEYLRVYPKTLAAGTVIVIPFSYGPAAAATANFRITVQSGAQVTALNILDPSPTAAATVRWRATFDQGISGVTAANFAFINAAGITGLSIASVTPDTAQPSVNWTITANTGTGNGLLGLKWVGHVSESPSVPNAFTGQSYDFKFGPVITQNPTNIAINRGTTTTLTVAASLRGGGTPTYQWYLGNAGFTNTATLLAGATSPSYTPPNFSSVGGFNYFCRVVSGPGNYSDSANATVTVVDPPQITASPASQTITRGQTATLSVSANGTALHYTWYRGAAGDTSAQVGTDSSTYTTPTLTNDASYWVRVYNAGPTIANSAVANITVLEAPSLVVTTTNDVVNNKDGLTSLREALKYAETKPGADVITFTNGLFGTITLTSQWTGATTASLLEVTNQDVAISGPGTSPGITIAAAPGSNLRHLFVYPGSSLTLSNLTFTGGRSSTSGGSISSQGSLTVRGCAFTGNIAANEAGAIHSWTSAPLLLVENSTISGNICSNIASAISVGASTVTLRHVTITSNSAPNGVLWLFNTPMDARNCLLAGNSTDAILYAGTGAFSASSVNNLIGAPSALGLVQGVNNNVLGVSGASLRLGPLANNGGATPTHALLPGSVAINAGSASATLATDQRGLPRRALTGGGLLGRFYSLPFTAGTTLLAPLSTLEVQPPNAFALTPRIDFGAGTEVAPGDGSVLDRGGSSGNIFGGLGLSLATDNHAVIWNGFINVPESATYGFTLRSDDGSVLYIDDALVVNNNNLQPITNASATVTLTAGLHAIRAGYFEAGGDAGMQLSWEKLNGVVPFARQIIPSSALYSGSAPDIGAFEDPTGLELPRILSTATATFVTDVSNSFAVASTGFLSPTISVSGALPAGVTVSAAGLLTGTPTAGAIGTYPFLLCASNSAGAVTQSFTLTVIDRNSVLARPSFIGNGALWSLNGDTVNGGPRITNDVFVITDGSAGQNRAAWFGVPLYVGAFDASFTYQDIGGGGADGVAFVVQNDPRGTTAIGAGGGGLGYAGITPSVAVLLNIYNGASGGVGMQLRVDGAGNPYHGTAPVNLAGGNPIQVQLRYAGSLLHVTLTDTVTSGSFSTNYSVNIPSVVGTNAAWVGITGSEGGVLSSQTVSGFRFNPLPTLAIGSAGTNGVVLSWPAAVYGYNVQSNNTLTATNWSAVGFSVTRTNDANQVFLPPTGAARFLRLVLPP